MNFLFVLKIICALATIATGLYSLLKPGGIKGFTGLEAVGPRGITEIRAVMGGAFIGIGLAPLLLGGNVPYQALGVMYVCVAAIRAVSMGLDGSVMRSNIISLIIEVAFGVILVV
jgi:hypothetical protein